MSTAVGELLRTLVWVDRRAAVWCAAQCARTVLHLIPEEEDQPREAITLAEGWVRGEATGPRCEELAANGRYAGSSIARIAIHAAFTAASAAATDNEQDLLHDVSLVIDSVADCFGGLSGDATGNPRDLATLVSDLRWSLTSPTADQLHGAPEAVRVAWDLIAADPRTEHTIPELLEAHARAQRLGLDWSDPVRRAIAERTPDEGPVAQRVRALLGGGR